MASVRVWALVGLLAGSALAACASGGNSSSARPDSGAGQGGSAAGGTSGAGATGGTSGTGGAATGGTAGAGATAGSAGSAAAGSAGSGAAGQAGSGVDAAAGQAGAAGMDAGAAGADAAPDSCASMPEICNGLDDNCDGQIDENDPGSGAACNATGKLGVCTAGTQHCQSGVLVCVSNTTPSVEICDGLDNDCNGVVDDNNPGGNKTCDTGLKGICQTGTTQCVNGQLECQQNIQATTEVCNGLDDDCDGVPDNGFSGAGQPCTVSGQLPNTPCADGLTTCLQGQNNCAQVNFVKPETCDGIDNDCNGSVDDGLDGKACVTGLPGVCTTGKTQCDAGTPSCIPDIAPGSTIETCNGKDDDCNGVVDDVVDTTLDCGTKNPSAQNVQTWLCAGAGICKVGACAAGYADCDGSPGNGCEVDLRSNTSHCGSCAGVCSGVNGVPVCNNGACGIACSQGYGNCDGDVSNGCETQTATDLANCGGCGQVCASVNGTASCSSGVCSLACNAGYASCDGSSANGCETPLDTVTHCGACNKACSSTGGTPSCVGGACQIACSPGYGDCDGNVDTGCETALDTVSHCGACTTACGSANGVAACQSGSCAIACNSGWGDCDGSTNNGCETNLDSSTSHCGTCTKVCSSNNGTPSCTSGSCSISCGAGFGDCDNDATNGCETTTLDNPAHCGSCANVCSVVGGHGSATCSGSTCGVACDPGYANCNGTLSDGCETSTASDPSNCGACNKVCGSANATATCSGGNCSVTCNGGYGNCNGDASDGCEANFAIDPSNCGGCGTSCTAPNATTTCSSGSCAIVSCAPYYFDLDKDPSNGCEYKCDFATPSAEVCDGKDNDCDGQVDEDFDLTSDPNNCGSCGTTCGTATGGLCCNSACQISDPNNCGACGQVCTPGMLVINEIMANPNAVADTQGEWFELYNPNAFDVDIRGFVIQDLGTDTHTISSALPVVVPAGGLATLGNNGNPATNGGVTEIYQYGGVTLANSADELLLVAHGVELDRVVWASSSFAPAGKSMELGLSHQDATANDVLANWCAATTAYGLGDLGTPGATNTCP